MIVVYARCVVSGQNLDKFLALAKELVIKTREEQENISYELIRCREGKSVYAFLERWPNQEVLDAHMRTEHFTRLIPQIQKVTVGKIDITSHDILL